MGDEILKRRATDQLEMEVRMSVTETNLGHLSHRVGKLEVNQDHLTGQVGIFHDSINSLIGQLQTFNGNMTHINSAVADTTSKVSIHENWITQVTTVWITLSKVGAITTAVGAAIWAVATYFGVGK